MTGDYWKLIPNICAAIVCIYLNSINPNLSPSTMFVNAIRQQHKFYIEMRKLMILVKFTLQIIKHPVMLSN